MPSFEFLDKVELFVRSGTFPANTSKSSKKVTRAASKHFLYKDGGLWRRYRGRLLRVVRSDKEVREILTRYHDNNNHAGQGRAVKEIMLMYYWVGVTEAVKTWIKACAVCQSQRPTKPPDPPIQSCLAYGCDASSFANPELSFHRFPKEAERRRRWLAAAQRDEGSLRVTSHLCSRHFEPSCFTANEEGRLTLSADATPTSLPVTAQEDEVPLPSDDDFLQPNSLEDFLSAAAAAAETSEASEPTCHPPETPVELQEHQYCLPAPDPDSTAALIKKAFKRRKSTFEPSFEVYDQIARFLSHRVLPMWSKRSRFSFKRMAKRFCLEDGVLMYSRVSPPLRVPRSREEVNSILKQFHDNQGHSGQGICQREITKHFYWASLTRDLARWISSCSTCLSRTKRRWLRCSVSNCTNCCGPVERGLGITFHKFPLHESALLARWLKAVGRPHWHPRLWSSVCSAHFTDDCLDRGGGEVAVRPDAVPTLLVHSVSATPSGGSAQPVVTGEAYFAKFNAVELYLSRRTYPPGLSYVEKNTFRRFCKSFTMKDEKLHMVRGDQVRLVLRSRQQVEAALVDFHNELNHLNVNKCLRLLNERFFWKTMRPDVMQWINSCPQCSGRKRKQPETDPGSDLPPEGPRSPRIPDSRKEDDDDDDDDDDEERDDAGGDEGGGSVSDEERQPATSSEVTVTPISPQPRVPILLHLRAPNNSQPRTPIILQPRTPIILQPRTPIILQPRTPIILQPRTPNPPFVSRVWSVTRATPPQSEALKETNRSDVQPESQSGVQVQAGTRPTKPGDQNQASGSQGATTHHGAEPTESRQSRELKTPSHTPTQTRRHGGDEHPEKKKRDLEAGASKKKSATCGLEPVMAPSTKPWPVFTVAGSAPPQTAGPPPEADSSASCRRLRTLRARTIIQQCSHAKVKTKPALDGADAQWAEIQEGIVVYVCFFHGATEDVTHQMADSLMTTRLFRKDSGHSVSVLDLPGNVLLIPQDSLQGEPVPKRRVQYKGGCELWWGAQLFSNLVSACREFMSDSVKCTKAGVKVEHGVFGQKQEIVLTSLEPMTLLLEF